MKIGKYTPSQIRKAIVAVAGAIGLLATSFLEDFVGLIPDSWSGPVTWVIGVAIALGVFLTKNAPLIDAADEL
ncbi:hypothetical protein PBI_BIGNUZ_28 [Mycobacterium phage BigNuz]|uniref:Uncharacterized protein n=2 Tax=Bignuzvirus bignuz TaxID=1983736 RepID=G1JX43_9CAUD|nr:hypothetical protein PBI_BIGNUZ_28 [Mycobacterium phage BigNuz]AEL98191.1 hypothetical protein PBI_BIGNUZ_28 [Mycobacterium phage BigNuz]AOT24867.1 hypothetical protein PBI_NAZO_28 [Mycobacterium phage Nazo]